MNSRLPAVVLLLFGLTLSHLCAQTSTSVENLTSVSSLNVKNGLGFNLGGGYVDQWQFQLAAAAGASEVRWQPSWGSVQNTAGTFSFGTGNQQAMAWCSQYGLQPLLTAAYGAPYKATGTYTVAQNCPIGTYTIPLTQAISNITVPYCHVLETNGTQITPLWNWGYYGALIASYNTTADTITLAAPTAVALTSGQQLLVNTLLYPSCATESPSDPSVVAYCTYVSYLASQIHNAGITGRVEIWNEPPWAHDQWDGRMSFYNPSTNAPSGVTATSPNFGSAQLLATTDLPPSGVTYNWGGPEKTGSQSMLTGRMSPALTAAEVSGGMAYESLHPYGNNPEDNISWNPTLLAAWNGSGNNEINGTWWYMGGYCDLPGTNHTGNFIWVHKLQLLSSTGLQETVTETGIEAPAATTAGWLAQAKFDIRQYLTMLTLGMQRINFYLLSDVNTPSDTFSMVNPTTQVPYQSYTALKGLVAGDMANLSVAPLAYTSTNLPTVPAYSGTYPLTTLSIVGRTSSTDTANTIYYVAYQRSMCASGPVTNLTATAGNDSVTLTWTPNGYAEKGTVLRSTTEGGPYNQLATLTQTFYSNPVYVDSTAVNGTPYYYVVQEGNPGGTSSNSNEVSAVPASSGTGTVNDSSAPAGAAPESWAYDQAYANMAPAAASVTVQIPTGYVATTAWDLVTRSSVPVSFSGTTATYAVSDDPVSLAVTPVKVNINFASGSTVGLTANGYTATDLTLNITLNFVPTVGTVLTVINNTSSNPITGTFTNLPGGGTLEVDSSGVAYYFTANYEGGDGNDLTLTYTGSAPLPGGDTPTMPVWALAILGLLLAGTAARIMSKPNLTALLFLAVLAGARLLFPPRQRVVTRSWRNGRRASFRY